MPTRVRPARPVPARWTIGSAWLSGVAELLAMHGLDVPALFAEAALDISLLDRADSRFAVEGVDRLWALAELRSGQPHIALTRPPVDTPTSFDVLAYAMMSCIDLGEAVSRLASYRAVVSDAVDLRLADTAGGRRIEILPLEAPAPGRASRLDYTIVTFLAFCRWVTCRNIVPLAVELAYPAPVDTSPHVAAFACRPRFGAHCHALLLRDEDLRLPLPTSNNALSRLHDQVVREQLQRLQPAGIEGRVAATLLRRIGERGIRRHEVAAELCMSDRTLQRRLAESGTTFKQEVDTLRRHMAENYLREAALPLAGIAHLLGFAEESSFFRACQRWFGTSPAQVMARGAPVDR